MFEHTTWPLQVSMVQKSVNLRFEHSSEGFSSYLSHLYSNLINALTNSLTDWLTHSLTHWMTDWLIGWLTDWLAGWLTGWLAGWLAGWLIDWLTDQPTDRCLDHFFEWIELHMYMYLNELWVSHCWTNKYHTIVQVCETECNSSLNKTKTVSVTNLRSILLGKGWGREGRGI